MKKGNKQVFVCQNCGYESSKWMGQCSNCGTWGGMQEEDVVETVLGSREKIRATSLGTIPINEKKRFPSGLKELDRVLGGNGEVDGFVNGQVILLSGQPGIGKSTLLLQVAFHAVVKGMKCFYVSSEESESQIAIRADRIISGGDAESIRAGLKIISGHKVEEIMALIESDAPDLVIWDSIQTLYSSESKSISGSVSQIKICANKIVDHAKSKNIITILTGHINKDGIIAGPKLLEHLVDTVLQLEGDEVRGFRMLRSLKNRFGTTNEVGMFVMTGHGMEDLLDPSKIFHASNVDDLVGVCKTVVIEGVRPLIVEVQALTTSTVFPLPKRVAEGISVARLQRIIAILSKYSKVKLDGYDVYVKIAGGLKTVDPSIDLAIAIAIFSSSKNKKVSAKMVAYGELNLSGEVTNVSREDDRAREAKRLGYSKIVNKKVLSCVNDISSGVV